jgi:hypothetical protein
MLPGGIRSNLLGGTVRYPWFSAILPWMIGLATSPRRDINPPTWASNSGFFKRTFLPVKLIVRSSRGLIIGKTLDDEGGVKSEGKLANVFVKLIVPPITGCNKDLVTVMFRAASPDIPPVRVPGRGFSSNGILAAVSVKGFATAGGAASP